MENNPRGKVAKNQDPSSQGSFARVINGFRPSIVGKKKAARSWIILILVIALFLSPLIAWAASNSR
jgi:hypothetical protein